MPSEKWSAIRQAIEGLAGRPLATTTFFVVPMEWEGGSLLPRPAIPVTSGSAAIEVAGAMQSTCAGVVAVAMASDGPLVLARYGETEGESDELK